jgi:hypothetical protein
MIEPRILGALVVISTVVGCGDGSATVSGTVTFNGEPIPGGPRMYGTVTFYPESGRGAPAVGLIGEAGRYELQTGARSRLAPGPYLVGIAVKKITMPTRPDEMPQPTLITPKKYASVTGSGLREEVKPGNNTFDFALNSNG